MGLEYLKITPEIMLKISAYEEEAQGRLMLAMIAYALEGREPAFDGLEKFIWPTLKMDIDRCAASIEKQAANGSRGGRPRQSHAKQEETQTQDRESQRNPEKPKETQTQARESLNTNTNNNSNTNNQEEDEEERACARGEAAPAAAADEQVIGIDGTDLSGAMADYDRAGELVSRFKLPDNDISRGAIIEDAGRVGWERVEKALTEAANANSRPMLSINFYRAVLKNEGKPREAGGGRSEKNGANREMMLRYTPEERREAYSAAILDFDKE